jgi:hypothetical protein
MLDRTSRASWSIAMWKKVAIGVGLIAVVLVVTVVVSDQWPSNDPPFPVGMTMDEVEEYRQPGFMASGAHLSGGCIMTFEDVDCLGKCRVIRVTFEDSRVVESKVWYTYRTKPRWLEKLLTRIGW